MNAPNFPIFLKRQLFSVPSYRREKNFDEYSNFSHVLFDFQIFLRKYTDFFLLSPDFSQKYFFSHFLGLPGFLQPCVRIFKYPHNFKIQCLSHFKPCFIFIPRENVRKPEVF